MANLPASSQARLTIRPTTPADRPVLERLWLLFRHDMSEVSGALPDPSGQFRRERLDAAFTEEIAFQDANPPAVRFWRAVATDAVGQAWTAEHRAVPGRPNVPPDTWISFSTA